MKNEKLYKEVESICRAEHIMENHYDVDSFSDNDPYFTTS